MCRTPSNKAGSAFVMMATGSPVQGSLRTLRNIELSEASSSTEKSDKKNSEPNKEASATKEKVCFPLSFVLKILCYVFF